MRRRPNILVTGTPGVGKSTFSGMLANRFGLVHIRVSELIQEKHLWEERDEERDCTIYSEQLLDDELQSIIEAHLEGGLIFDFHSADILTTPQVDIVVVLQCESDLLWQRLAARGYAEEKVRENVEAEIFQILLEEVQEDFPEDMVVQIQSNTLEDLEKGLARIEELITPEDE